MSHAPFVCPHCGLKFERKRSMLWRKERRWYPKYGWKEEWVRDRYKTHKDGSTNRLEPHIGHARRAKHIESCLRNQTIRDYGSPHPLLDWM